MFSGRWLRKGIRHAAVAAVMMGLMGGTGRPQLGRQQPVTTIPGQQTKPDPLDPLSKDRKEDGLPAAIGERQAKARNDERQRRLVSDTDKLLELATSLHDDVAKTDKNVLSLDVVRRAEEIEKLARSVKERMKG